MIANVMRRRFASRVFVEGFPSHWDREMIGTHFRLVGPLTNVHLVMNSLGQCTGKAVVTFDDDKDGEIAVKRMDNRAVENLILSVKPYMDKQDKRPRQAESLLSRRIYLMNVPYDASMEELDGLVSKFAPVDQVVVPRDK